MWKYIPWLRLWSGGGRRIAVKIVLIFLFVHIAWDLVIYKYVPVSETESDFVGILITAVATYLLLVYGFRSILYPEGAVGIDKPARRPACESEATVGPPPVEPEPSRGITISGGRGAPAISNEPDSSIPETGCPPGPVSPSSLPVLLVDNDQHFLSSAGLHLRASGISPVLAIEDTREVLPFLARNDAALMVLNLADRNLSGMELLPKVKEEYPHLPVIVTTGMMEVETAVTCMKAGAFDYLIKPLEINRFVSSVKRAMELRELRHQVTALSEHLHTDPPDACLAEHGIITRNRKMMDIFRYVQSIACSVHPVLITGETGTGKELVARAIHRLSGRAGEFVAVNVAGLDDAMISDTLFGHRKGAFTGADQPRGGLISQAKGGTLLLDEIGDLSESFQVKLLRLLEEREYYQLGSDVPRETDARILCATHRNLKEDTATGKFRKDLFYRLSTHRVHLPPLRERMEDLPPLIERFLEEAAQSAGKRKPTPPCELITLLSNYHFPGNVRELRAAVSDAVTQHRTGVLSLKCFNRILGDRVQATSGPSNDPTARSTNGAAPFLMQDYFPTLREAEEFLVAEALRRSSNNQRIAAMLLGISRFTLNKRLMRNRKNAEPDLLKGCGETAMPDNCHLLS